MKIITLKQSIVFTSLIVGLIWCIKSFELLTHTDLSWLGVYPHRLSSLLGIITAPVIHGSVEHLFNNTLAMLLPGSFLMYGYPKSRWRVLGFIWLFSGLGVWLFARDAYHIGASGLTHGVFFYLFVISILRRDKSSVALMMGAFLLYGGMTMTIFPREPGISFEYHFFGALAGSIAALIWRKLDPKPIEKHYDWEKAENADDSVIGDDWQVDVNSHKDHTRKAHVKEHKPTHRTHHCNKDIH
ncbi:rhomboid family intramembrane serine protease [Aliiglaciecola sp. LCG003]|uniref:rhomboid family intramembrane serine protease n=1 Tax=Aliiglaciecola sp. LCG003 TaxID=3053655 RepID=UPI002572E001|nr:rhomboid family intramembrane serine protease [Aliiglaciecola sp. LCG003]WJG07760.1 rhomboid family intramembrane serine protease [Aliiglaciecola sp. LCG003]